MVGEKRRVDAWKMATCARRGWPASSVSCFGGSTTQNCHRVVAPVGFDTPEPRRKRRSCSKDRPPVPPAPTKRARQVKADTFKRISMVQGGARLCKPWNDGRGCSHKGRKNLRQCDVKLENG